ADEIGQALSGLVRVAALERLEARDPVDTEIAEVRPPLAPGADRPGAAPVVERERPDVALARLSARVAVIEVQHAARADRLAHRFQLPHGAAVDVEPRRVQARLLYRHAPVGGKRRADFLHRGAPRFGYDRPPSSSHPARASIWRLVLSRR